MKKVICVILTLMLIITSLPIAVFADTSEPIVRVENVYTASGSTVDVNISVENNPGIAGARFTISFDERLTLINAVECEAFENLDYTGPGKLTSPCNFTWDSLNDASNLNGNIIRLTFEVSNSVEPEDILPINISCINGDVYDTDLNSINTNLVNGSITIIDYIPGDVNGDDTVSGKDVTLVRRYLAGGYDVTIREEAADVNADASVSGKDVTLLRRYLAGGYDVVLKPSPLGERKCSHKMTHYVAKESTCLEDGNLEYYECKKCGKLFNDENGYSKTTLEAVKKLKLGHDIEFVDAKPATTTESGYTAGEWCNRCKTWIVGHEIIEPLEPNEYNVDYRCYYVMQRDDSTGKTIVSQDDFLKTQTIKLNNELTYFEGQGICPLEDPFVEGYIFYGWFERPDADSKRIYEIGSNETGNKIVYGIWVLKSMQITYLPDSSSSILPKIENDQYYIDRDTSLKVPSWPNLVWIGWSDTNGNILKNISKGTYGNISLTANWMSKRNQTVPKTNYADKTPAIVANEADGIYAFTYEIGEMQNVPIQVLPDQNGNSVFNLVNGESIEFKSKVDKEITETQAKTIANSVANATTKSDSWTLSEDWNKSTSFSNSQSSSVTEEQKMASEQSFAETGKYSISAGVGGSNTHTDETGKSTKTTKSHEFDVNVNLSLKNEIGSDLGGSIGDKDIASAKLDITGKRTTGLDVGLGYKYKTETQKENYEKHTDTLETNWNRSEGLELSSSLSQTNSFSQSIIESITKTYNYGETLDFGGSESNTVSSSNTSTNAMEYSSSVTYGTKTSEGTEITRSLTANADVGFYRVVRAANFKVFAVVIYDAKSSTYSTYSYSVMIKDSEHIFTDYSTISSFDDYENGVLPFEVPIFVAKYVYDLVGGSEGLAINPDTGVVERYGYKDPETGICYRHFNVDTGVYSDPCDTDVVIPDYIVVSIDKNNKKIVPVTGIGRDVFSGTTITSVRLSSKIERIPDSAFKNCKELRYVAGGNVVSIGEEAFYNCTSLYTMEIPKTVNYIGNDAFVNVDTISVDAISSDVADAAFLSGVENLTVDFTYIKDSYDNKRISVGNNMKNLVLCGGGKTFNNLSIKAELDSLTLNYITIKNDSNSILDLDTGKLYLEHSTILGNGVVFKLANDTTKIILDGNNYVQSESSVAILSKNLQFYEKDGSTSIGKVYIKGNCIVFGVASANGLVGFDQAYDKFICVSNNQSIVFKNSDGSVIEEENISFENVIDIFETKKPSETEENYEFNGWVLEANSTLKADIVELLKNGEAIEVYASWIPKNYTLKFNANGGTVSTTSKLVRKNQTVGQLPVPTRDYYTFDGWYTEANGGTKVTDTSVFDVTGEKTIYAHWTVNAYSVSWDNGTGYKITVNRKSSPNKGAATGELSNGAAVYYGDVLSITYSATTGYEIKSYGSTDITVTGNVDSRTICCSADAKKITYNVVYKSSNGTALGSTTVTYAYASGAHSISAPAKSGYNTPPAQSVQWDSASAKTITFVYYPTSVSNSQSIGSGWWWQYNTSNLGVKYSATAEIGTRTSSSVQIRIVWTNSITNAMYGYTQTFSASVNGWNTANTGSVTIANASKWNGGYYTDSTTVYSGWMTVPVSATTTSVAIACDYQTQGSYTGSVNKTITIPTF